MRRGDSDMFFCGPYGPSIDETTIEGENDSLKENV